MERNNVYKKKVMLLQCVRTTNKKGFRWLFLNFASCNTILSIKSVIWRSYTFNMRNTFSLNLPASKNNRLKLE